MTAVDERREKVPIVDRIQVVDVHSHVMEPPTLWTDRVSSKWGDLVPYVRRDDKAGIDRWWIGNRRGSAVANFAVANWNEFPPSFPPFVEDADPAAWDPPERLARLTEVGIHQQLLYLNILGFSSIYFFDLDPELRYECVRAYNDWLTEFCSADPNRLMP